MTEETLLEFQTPEERLVKDSPKTVKVGSFVRMIAVIVRSVEFKPVTEAIPSVAVGLVAPPIAYLRRFSSVGALVPSHSAYNVLTVPYTAISFAGAPTDVMETSPPIEPTVAVAATRT
jgi:hypothetical protein